MLNFESYLNRVVENIEQTPDAKKYSVIADYFKTSVSLVKQLQHNIFVAETPIGDKLVYCLSEQDIDDNYNSMCDKMTTEAIGQMFLWKPKTMMWKKNLKPCKIVDSNFPLTESGTYRGLWSAYEITLENGQMLKTDSGIRGSCSVEVDIFNGEAVVYEYLKPDFFNDVQLKNSFMDIFRSYYTTKEVVQALLQKMAPEWLKTIEVLHQGYKLYLPI